VIALQRVVQMTQQHRGIASGMLGGNEALAAKWPKTRDALWRAVEALDASLKSADVSPAVASRWTARKERLAGLEQAIADFGLRPADSFVQHTQLIAELFALNADLLDEFGLSLDSRADSAALIAGAFINAPGLAEKLGQMRAQGAGFLNAGTLTPEGRARLAALRDRVDEIQAEMGRNLRRASTSNAALNAALASKAEALKARIAQTLTVADQSLIKSTDLKLTSQEYFQEFTNTIDSVYEFDALASQSLVNLLDARMAELRKALYLVLGVLIGSLLASLLLSLAVVRSITTPVQEALQLAHAVAQGDLTATASVHGSNEMGRLMQALKAMQQNLATVVNNVRLNAEGVATASAQIAQGNQDLSQRTEEQASALEQTAAAMEQLGSTVRHNADNAKQANRLAQGASIVAVKGGQVVGQVVEMMQVINDSSKKVADITGVIDAIAFQSNILALNAAVEAARAGEQGRGFAVVAGEVRNLAQRSADAAKEIRELITASVEGVEQGTALVGRAGTTMTEIVSSIQRVTDLMGEISAASIEQSTGVSQVGDAVSQMDRVTQQNAALVEESAAAAESLKGQARHLVQAVAVFKLTRADLADAVDVVDGPDRTAATEPDGIERRGPERATNVTRPDFGDKARSRPSEPHAIPATVRTATDAWAIY
jgi:methyl-accepting chemotaxis protein